MRSKKITPIIWLLTFSLLITTTKLWKTFSTYSWTSRMCSSRNFSIAITLISIWITIITVLVRTKYRYINKNFNNFTYLLTSLLIITTIFFITDNLLIIYITFEASLILLTNASTLGFLYLWYSYDKFDTPFSRSFENTNTSYIPRFIPLPPIGACTWAASPVKKIFPVKRWFQNVKNFQLLEAMRLKTDHK